MAKSENFIATSDRFYSALLLLYPRRFRTRFGREMSQVFRDSTELQLERGATRDLLAFWLHTLGDTAMSVPREWRREPRFLDSELDFTGIMDLCIVSFVVGANLLGWGWMGARLALNLTLPDLMQYSMTVAIILMGIVTVALAALIGILSASLVSRSSRPQRHRISA